MASTRMRVNLREEFRAFEDHPRREVHTKGLDHHVDVPKYVPDRVGIKRVAHHLSEICILDWLPAAERAKARTLWPARSAALTVSSPMPWLAPMMRTLAMIYQTHIYFRTSIDKQVTR